jgi:adenine phosphoribosyltransferase
MTLDLLRKTLQEAPIIKRGTYSYFVHPISDGIPAVQPALLNEVIDELQKRIEPHRPIDKIVTVEAMGIPITTLLSSKTNIPFVVIRKHKYDLPGEIKVEQTTGYAQTILYINDLNKGDEIIIVDDVISTGGTLNAVLAALRGMDVVVKGVLIVVNKGDCIDALQDKYNVKIEALLTIRIENKKILLI